MAGFDPDAYLAAPPKRSAQPAQRFDPDAYLGARAPEVQPSEPVTAQPVSEPATPPPSKGDRIARAGFAAAGATPLGAALPRGTFASLEEFARALRHGEGPAAAASSAGRAWESERASTAPTQTESLRRGGIQGATLGFRDEATGALSALGGSLVDSLRRGPGELTGEDMVRLVTRYQNARDSSRAADDTARGANPGTYFAGEMAGGAAIPAGAAASGASLAAKVLRGAGAGGLAGALQGLGTSRDDPSGDAITGGLIGGAIGGSIPVVGAGASRAINALPQSLKSAASEYALRASGYIGNDFKRLIKGRGEEGAEVIGRELLDAGVIPAGGTVRDVLERIGPAKQSAGAQVGEFVERAAQTGKQFDLAPFVGRVQDEIINPNMSSPAVRPMAQRVSGHLDELMDVALPDGGRVPFPLAQKWKTDSQGVLNYGNPWNNAGPNIPADSMNKDLTRLLKESLDDQVEGALGPGTASKFQAARRRYGALADAEDRAREGVARLAGNNKASVTDMKLGELVSKAAESVPFVGPLAVGGSRMVRQRADSLLARGADAAADLAATPGGTRFRQLAAALAESGAITPSAARALVAQQEAEEAQGPRTAPR